ncbi:MAG TPA: ATP-binding protein [Acidimicrobiales bacterium]|jgi:two-component system, cell cycle sensor histidine kinase and response regulator CckA|nr:ATP-binding protein [Acidimicrobiales bacterium]
MVVWLLAHAAVVVAVVVSAVVIVSQVRRSRRATEQTLEALSSVTDPALARLAPDELFRELLGRATRALDADVATLLVTDDTGTRLTVRAQIGLDAFVSAPADLAMGAGLPGRVAATGAPLLANDVSPSDVDLEALRPVVRSFLGTPLLVDGDVRGVLAIASRRPGAFTADDLRLVGRVVDRFAWAVERERFDEADRLVREAAEENEHRIRTMVEAAPVGMIEADVDGRVLRWNRVAASLLGWPRWLPGQEGTVDLPESAVSSVATAAEGHRVEGVAVVLERDGARPADVVISAAPFTDREGNVEGVLVLLNDVTERQQLEQHIRQAQRLEAMARLAGGIAHDFNNLLTVVRGHSEVLLKTLPEGDGRREDADAIRIASERAADLTKQLLAIGRRQRTEPEVLDLHDRVRELEPVLHRLVGDGAELRVVAGTAGHVRVDPGDLDQAVMNLVINARDAVAARADGAASGGRIMVECRTIEMRPRGAALAGVTAGRYVVLTVADTGTGMPKEVVEHCFDPFFSTKGRGKGTGLGLALVYGTATSAGGHATVESEVGRGTTFRVWFPEVDPKSAEPMPAATRRRRRSGRVPTRPVRVLLVDDEAPVRSLARAALEEAGHDVVEAASAEEAMTKADAEREPIDVLVSDVVLGGVRGDELAAKLKKKWKALCVVLMSGYADQPLAVDPDAFLAKPFALDDLASTVLDVTTAQPRAGARSRNPTKRT